MGQIQVYTMPSCDTCDSGISHAPVYVVGNAEKFCGLECCKLFYAKSTMQISKHRKARAYV